MTGPIFRDWTISRRGQFSFVDLLETHRTTPHRYGVRYAKHCLPVWVVNEEILQVILFTYNNGCVSSTKCDTEAICTTESVLSLCPCRGSPPIQIICVSFVPQCEVISPYGIFPTRLHFSATVSKQAQRPKQPNRQLVNDVCLQCSPCDAMSTKARTSIKRQNIISVECQDPSTKCHRA